MEKTHVFVEIFSERPHVKFTISTDSTIISSLDLFEAKGNPYPKLVLLFGLFISFDFLLLCKSKTSRIKNSTIPILRKHMYHQEINLVNNNNIPHKFESSSNWKIKGWYEHFWQEKLVKYHYFKSAKQWFDKVLGSLGRLCGRSQTRKGPSVESRKPVSWPVVLWLLP